MAVVYEGRQTQLDRPVALKVLAAHLAGDPAFRERFLREARLAARLHHPNLVRVFDIAELEGLPCIVMELLPGGTLQDGRLSHAEAAQVADGLAAAHARGVVHRDLKPANLLRAGDGTVKIADFGIARAVEETRLTQIGTVLGTLRYLAPEQAAGDETGPAADVYSLGVVLDELVDERTRELDALLDACRSDDPARRPTAAEVAAALRDETRPAPTLALPRRHRTKLRPVLVLAALVLVAVVVAVAVAATNGGPPKPATVEPVPHSTDAAQEARNLAAWLAAHSAPPGG
jgi:hypothetical protein